MIVYRVCGLAVTAGIPVKFGTAHGRLRQELGSANALAPMGKRGFPGSTKKLVLLSKKI